MHPDDVTLTECNESELHWLARIQGLPFLRRDIPRDELIAIVSGEVKVEQRHLSGTNFTRERLEKFIQINIDRVRGQLPGCDGKCTKFPCTEGKHMTCFCPNEALLIS